MEFKIDTIVCGDSKGYAGETQITPQQFVEWTKSVWHIRPVQDPVHPAVAGLDQHP